MEAVCVIARVAREEPTALDCSLTLVLKGGALVARAVIHPYESDPYHLAIVGGTQTYRGARGDLAVSHPFPEREGRKALFVIGPV
jgi:hypothetical protein